MKATGMITGVFLKSGEKVLRSVEVPCRVNCFYIAFKISALKWNGKKVATQFYL